MINFLIINNKDERQYREFQKYFDVTGVKYKLLHSFKEIDTISNKKNYVICSNPKSVILLKLYRIIRLKKYSIIYRSRGLSPEETYFKTKSYIKYVVLTAVEFFSNLLSDYILLVSDEHRKFIQSKYKYVKNLEVIHNYNLDFKYANIPKKDSGEKVNICYSGSVSKWQSIDIVLDVFERLHEANNNLEFFFLSDQINKISENIAQKYNFVQFVSCDEKVLPTRLTEMDFGIIIRDDISLNQVASPFKMMDYLTAGLKIISTDNIGDYYTLFKENGLFYFDNYYNFKNGKNIENLNKFVSNGFNETDENYEEIYRIINVRKELNDFFSKII